MLAFCASPSLLWSQQSPEQTAELNKIRANGYVEAVWVTDSSGLHIQRGPKYQWGELTFEGDSVTFESDLPSDIPLNELQVRLMERCSLLANQGFPFASVTFEQVNIVDSTLHAHLVLTKGPFITYDSLKIEPNLVSSKYLGRAINILPGEPFDFSAVNQAEKRLKTIRFVRPAKSVMWEFTEESASPTFHLEKVNASLVEGLVGILPSGNGEVLFTGKVDLQLVNGLKQGERFAFQWQRLDTASQTLDLHFFHPYVFGTSAGYQFETMIYKRDTNISFNGEIGLNYMFERENFIGGFLERTEASIASLNSSNQQSVKSNKGGITILFDLTDQFINPTKGWYVRIKGGAGNRTRNSEAVDIEETQVKAHWQIRKFIPLTGKHVLLLANQSGYISGSDLLEGELFRVSGALGQRGFNEEDLFGSQFSTSTFEYRYRFEQYSFARLFTDVSYYKHPSRVADWPQGFGLGLAISAKAGIVSIDYAIGKQLDNPFLLKTAKVHIGFKGVF